MDDLENGCVKRFVFGNKGDDPHDGLGPRQCDFGIAIYLPLSPFFHGICCQWIPPNPLA